MIPLGPCQASLEELCEVFAGHVIPLRQTVDIPLQKPAPARRSNTTGLFLFAQIFGREPGLQHPVFVGLSSGAASARVDGHLPLGLVHRLELCDDRGVLLVAVQIVSLGGVGNDVEELVRRAVRRRV